MTSFLRAPRRIRKRLDLELALDRSRAWVRSMTEGAGFDRVTFLLTALRAQAWVVLITRGVALPAVQDYLGVQDRSTFRRACHRADVPVPWEVVGSGG